jgi:hypothetical protein
MRMTINELIEKWEKERYFVQSDIENASSPTVVMEAKVKIGIIDEIINDLKQLKEKEECSENY